ncbi:MAG: hypothetical protein AABW51_00620 [Nanoarchaeota archaeon]
MEKEKALKDFEEGFGRLKQELKFKTNLDEIDEIFFIRDVILQDGFVSKNLFRQMAYRIAEFYLRWNDYLHGLIMPNPQNILSLSESKIFNQEEKKIITNMIKKIMELNSKNILITLTRDKAEEGKFIDYSVNMWKSELQPEIIKLIKKINKEWGENK